ncbi:MAG: hypothetical protein IKH30_09505 [Clostridia bacterium]|nr:hypothetical protein [Clostridia bacterium]
MDVNFDKKAVEIIPGVVDTEKVKQEMIKNSLAFLQYIVDTDERDPKVAGKVCYDMLVEEYRQMQKVLYGKDLTQEELDEYRHSRQCHYDWASLMDIAREVTAENLPGFIEYLKKKDEEKKRLENG